MTNRQLPALIDVKLIPVMDLEQAKTHLSQLKQFVKFYLEEGIDKDYGYIPGCPKPSLFKSGANKLCDIYGMRPVYETVDILQDWGRTINGVLAPLFMYRVLAKVVRKADGLEMSQSFGTCNSYEAKYLWRKADRMCPDCESPSIRNSKAQYGGGFYCDAKNGGCGSSWKELATTSHNPSPEEQQMAAYIRAQPSGRKVNDDLFAADNTILMMAQKRGLVAATIAATRSSQLFTMDVEDSGDVVDPKASDGRRSEFIQEASELGYPTAEVQKYLIDNFGLKQGEIKESLTVGMCEKSLIYFRKNPITNAKVKQQEVKQPDPKQSTPAQKAEADPNAPKRTRGPNKPKENAKDGESHPQSNKPDGNQNKPDGNQTQTDIGAVTGPGNTSDSQTGPNAPTDASATNDDDEPADDVDFSSEFN